MIQTRLIGCKSLLTKSGITDYAVNCYVGCAHACAYCYARYMKRFTNHPEPWGTFVDVRVNAPEVLAKQLRRPRPGRVFVSSVCDAWQPLESEFGITRECVRLLAEAGYQVGALTKSALVERDLDLLAHPNCDLGVTITTADEKLRRQLEPGASPTAERVRVLREAARRGVKVWAFLGPFMPYLSDTQENIEALFGMLEGIPLDHYYADKLNLRPGVASSMGGFIARHYPGLGALYQELFMDEGAYQDYARRVQERVAKAAAKYGR